MRERAGTSGAGGGEVRRGEVGGGEAGEGRQWGKERKDMHRYLYRCLALVDGARDWKREWGLTFLRK